ncbi:MAG: response regulator [Herbinix sp.]|jgi:two-component system response regulator YesN|nr:response regulator [Herbinix sp.]
MYKVIIIDDEVLVRVGLKTTINWEEIGFTIVAEAANGEQGYEMYQKYKPDVIITDIKMPKQDGLWLTEKIRREDKDAKILVLTCYDEFGFVRKALKAGANDYILKSEVEDEELIKLMEALKEKLDVLNKDKKGKADQSTTTEELKHSVFMELIKKDFRVDDRLLIKLDSIKFPLTKVHYALIGISVVHHPDRMSDTTQINQAVLNLLTEQFNQQGIIFMDGLQEDNYQFLIAAPVLKTSDVKKLLTSTGNAASQYFNTAINAVFTNPFHTIEELGKLYQDYLEKVQVLFYQTNHISLIPIEQIRFSEPNVIELKKAHNREVLDAIGHEDIAKTKDFITRLGQYFEAEKITPMIVKIFYSNLLGDLFGSYGLFFENSEVFDTHQSYHYQIENSKHLAQINKLMIELAQKLVKEIQNMRYNNSHAMINQAVNYIEYHFAEKISLEDVAKELNISKHYLCSAFKKETGENMTLYINKIRIEKAKQILLEPDIKVKEIFERVGYSDQQYFSKVFKKITGMTVNEYKDSMTRK